MESRCVKYIVFQTSVRVGLEKHEAKITGTSCDHANYIVKGRGGPAGW